MTPPCIMTEHMRDGSDAIAYGPLLNALAMCFSQADLVAIHSGGGYARFMTSAGVTIVADGRPTALDNETSLGIMRYADAGYEAARDAAGAVNWFDLAEQT